MSREITFADAVHEALDEEMDADDSMLVLGEDVRYGYISDATAGLVDKYGEDRVLNTPISENSFVGVGLGTAMRGVPTVVEVMFDDLSMLTLDQFMNQAAKVPTIFDGQLDVPVVIRMLTGHFPAAFGPQHSKNLSAMFTHIPDLKVITPSNPRQAKGYLKTAINDPKPVVFLEHTRLIHKSGPVPEGDHVIGYEDGLEVAREGSDVVVISSGWMTTQALEAADTLADDGVDVRVLDVPVLDPLPAADIIEEVSSVGRVVIAEEGYPRCGVAGDISSLLAEEALYSLDTPIQTVSAQNTPIPANMEHQEAVIPNADDIVDAVRNIT